MSDPNLTPPPPDGAPSWTPPPAPQTPGPFSSPPLPGQMAAPQAPATPQAPPAPPAPPVYGAPAPPPPGSPGYGPPTQQPFPPQPYGTPMQQPYAQQPWAQPYSPQGGEGYLPELGRTLGSKGKRIGAKAIDLLVVVIFQAVVGGIIGIALFASSDSISSTGEFNTGFGGNLAASLVIALIILVFDFAYNVVCTAQFGGTPGKLALGLRVVSQDGPPADVSIAFRRWSPSFALIVLGAVPIVGIIAGLGRIGLLVANLVMILVDERRRDVFDHVGRTYVVEKQ